MKSEILKVLQDKNKIEIDYEQKVYKSIGEDKRSSKENRQIEEFLLEIDNLEKEELIKGIDIYQNKKYFKIGIDSILLSLFFIRNTKIKHEYISDFCAGTGIIGMYTYLKIIELIKEKNIKDINITLSNIKMEELKIDFVEKQEYFNTLLKYNKSAVNKKIKISENFNILEETDIESIMNNQELKDYYKERYTAILINPPYMVENNGLKTNTSKKDVAKIATETFLSNMFKVSKHSLKQNGELFLVSKLENITEIITVAKKEKLELKTMQLVIGKKNKPVLFLGRFVKNAKPFLTMMPNICIEKEETWKI